MTLAEFRLIESIARSVDRIATAEERRNKLLEEDQKARREVWEREFARQEQRWRQMSEPGPLVSGGKVEPA